MKARKLTGAPLSERHAQAPAQAASAKPDNTPTHQRRSVSQERSSGHFLQRRRSRGMLVTPRPSHAKVADRSVTKGITRDPPLASPERTPGKVRSYSRAGAKSTHRVSPSECTRSSFPTIQRGSQTRLAYKAAYPRRKDAASGISRLPRSRHRAGCGATAQATRAN